MQLRKEVLIIALIVTLILSGFSTAQVLLSTTSNANAIGMEMNVGQFGHVTNKIVGTTPDNRTEVTWVDYMSTFVKINNLPLVELKENFTVRLTEFDGAPAHPSGSSGGYFFPDIFDGDDWTFVPNVKTNTWHNILEYRIDERTHLVGGVGYKIFDPSPNFGANYVEDRPAYQFTNVGTDTVVIEPFFYERIAQNSGTLQFADANISDYDGIIPTSDDFVYDITDPNISPLPYFRGVGYPYAHYSLKNSGASVLPTLQGSGINYDLPDAGNPVNNASEMTFQYDPLVLAPGETGVYWLYPKVLKMENNSNSYPANIDFKIEIVSETNIDYPFAGTDVSIIYSNLDFVSNALTGIAQSEMSVTAVEISGGMIASSVPANIKPLDSRYWEVFYDTRRENTISDVTFTYNVNADSIQNLDSLTILYRLDYDEPWQEWMAYTLDAAAGTLTALSVYHGDIQYVLGERQVSVPATPILISIENGIDDLWYNPNLSWESDIPANYSLQVADNAEFINPIKSNTMFSNAASENYQFTNSNNLQDSVTYYWRVRAFNDAGTSDWSEIWSFTISNLNWRVLNSPTSGGTDINWNGIGFINPDSGYVAGDGGKIRKTIDGGLSWSYESTTVGEILGDVEIIDDTTLFVASSGGFLLEKGTGISWTTIQTGLNSGLLNDIDFPTRMVGYVAGGIGAESIIIKTEDGGATWNRLISPVNEILESVSFSNLNKGIAAGRNGAVLKTVNAGADWIPVVIPEFNNRKILAAAYINRTIYLGGEGGYILKSIDDGLTWTTTQTYRILSPFGSVSYTDFHFYDERNGYAVGSKSGIYQVVLRTIDGGNFWGLQNSNAKDTFDNQSGLSAVHFPNHNTGYAAGYDGTIIKYNSPSPNIIPGEAFVAAPIIDASPGEEVHIPLMMTLPPERSISSFETILGGFLGKVENLGIITDSSIVGDKKWSVEYNDTLSRFMVAAAGADTVSGNGVMFYLTLRIPDTTKIGFIPINIYSVIFDNGLMPVRFMNGGINIREKFVYGDVNNDGQIRAFDASLILQYLSKYITANDIDTLAADVSLDGSVSTLDASYILQFIVGKIDTLPHVGNIPAAGGVFSFASPVFGDSLKNVTVSLNVGSGENIFGLRFEIDYDETTLQFNNAENWIPGLDSAVKEINAINGKLFLSVAGSQSLSLDGLLASLHFDIIDPSKEQTEITLSALRLNEDSIMTNVSSVIIDFVSTVDDEAIPSKYSLGQNYPNPFNPSTTIKYSLPENGVVKIVLYNSLGERVSELVNEYHSAGQYQINFDASGLSSGIYFYSLTANSFRQVNKMILLK